MFLKSSSRILSVGIRPHGRPGASARKFDVPIAAAWRHLLTASSALLPSYFSL
jgi:hypothetical protein